MHTITHAIHHRPHPLAAALLAGLAASASIPSAHAGSMDAQDGSFEIYFGAGGGAAPMTLDSRDFSASSGKFFTDFSTTGGMTISQDNDLSGGYKGYIGVRLFRFFGLEAGAAGLGTVSFTAEVPGVFLGETYSDRGDYSASMNYVAALLTIPTGDDGSYFHIKAGTATVDVTLQETLSRQSFGTTVEEFTYTTSKTSRHQLFGLGYTMRIGEHSKWRIEVEHLGEIGDEYEFRGSPGRASVTFLSTSLMYSF